MRVLILGGDGYLGWATTVYLAEKGYQVGILDNFVKRKWEYELGIKPLFLVPHLSDRIKLHGIDVDLYAEDITKSVNAIRRFHPDTIIHYAEQPSAPFSMINRERAVETQYNNVIGTLNVLYAMKEYAPFCHLIKLGTMGEYGTPNIDIEEGYIDIEHNGRKDTVPFPKQANSFYHLSKVHDSNNIMFACKNWGLRATDLNQGVVYGFYKGTSFHYDAIFGTALNRFCVQAVHDIPLTVYGSGGQKRGFINIKDTLQCVELALNKPALPGKFRVFNQFTEVFSINNLADMVSDVTGAKIVRIKNPRKESEDHYYNPVCRHLDDLGLEKRHLKDELGEMLNVAKLATDIDKNEIKPKVFWE